MTRDLWAFGRIAAGPLLLFGSIGCSEPTGPDAAAIVIDASAEELAAAQVMVDDVTTRLFPSIAQLAGVAELESAVNAIALAVQRADAEDLDRNLRLAEDALNAVRVHATDAESADLSAIDLAIDGSTRLLRYPAQSAGRALNPRNR